MRNIRAAHQLHPIATIQEPQLRDRANGGHQGYAHVATRECGEDLAPIL